MLSNLRPTRLAHYMSALLLSITLLCQPGVREVAGEVLLSAVPAAEASGTTTGGGTAEWYGRCGALMALIATVSTAIAAGEAHRMYCTLNPTAECSAEDIAAIDEALEALQEQFDRLWNRARSLHCVD